MKILFGLGAVLIVLGGALIPLPGPGFLVLAIGVILSGIALALLRRNPEST